MRVHLLDVEWLLSTLFDASLLRLEPPATAALFLLFSFDRTGTRGGVKIVNGRFPGGQCGVRSLSVPSAGGPLFPAGNYVGIFAPPQRVSRFTERPRARNG
jgi:hypothetical protein